MDHNSHKIDGDNERFKKIVRGKIKKDLRKYISNGDMIGKKGGKKVTIPLPQIEIPRFRYDQRDMGGIGQGEGEEGKAGNQPGEHVLEVDITLDELADILGEELELPKIEPRGEDKLQSIKDKYTSIRRTGPESLRHFKRTFKHSLKRQIAMGTYDPKKPRIIPIREDKHYRSWKETPLPETNAVMIYMMDVSGSMGDEQKEIVRITSFWIDTWIQKHYENIESRYIIHDYTAKEVDREIFFHTNESGGTKISSAYECCIDIINRDYPISEWNIYPFHFSDGDNWGKEDSKFCSTLLRENLLPVSNVFCYGQVKSPYGSGKFIKDLRNLSNSLDGSNLITSEIKDREGIVDCIKDFLGTGK